MSKQTRDAVPAEDLNRALEELMDLAMERGLSARRAHESASAEETVVQARERDTPDIRGLLREELLAVLEEEVVPAVDAGAEQRIREDDVKREIVKKALVGLKLHTLQRIAVEQRLDRRGRSEEIAERIGRAYRFDEEAVARLILDNEEEPRPERGYTTRLFAISRRVAIAAASERLRLMSNRYIRIGVARWFVFSSLTRASESRLRIVGSVRSYQAFVNEEGDHPSLTATPSTSEVKVDIRDRAKAIQANGASAYSSRAAMAALRFATDIELLGYVPTPHAASGGRVMALDPRTVLLLDIVYNRLGRAGVRQQNLTVAKFQTTDEGRLAPEEAESPSLRAVRFEGDHILDSQQACTLIDRESRGLVDISLWVEAEIDSSDEAYAWFPVRLTIERDHVAVLTGYGRHRPELAAGLHRRITQQVSKALEEGPANNRHVEALAEEIHRRAVTPGQEERRWLRADAPEPLDKRDS